MGLLGFLAGLFFIPALLYALLLGSLGLWRRDIQALVALAVGLGILWLASESARGEHFAFLAVGPLLLAYATATASGIWLGYRLVAGHARFARYEDAIE